MSSKNDVFLVSASTDKIVVRDVQTNKVITETSTMHNTGTVKNVFTQLYRKKSDSTPRFRFLVTTRDGTNIMVSGESGETKWLEEGGLASVQEVLFTDRPDVSTKDANVMPSLYDRLQMQLDTLISSVPSFTLNSESNDDDSDAFFGFDRVALLRSETGAIYAIETSDGTQLWKTYVSNAKQMYLSNEKSLHVLCRDGTRDEIVTLRVSDGEIVSRSGELGFQVRQAVQYRNGAILLRDESNRVHVFGSEKHDEDFSGAFMYELDGNVLRGLSLRAIKSEITAVPTWQHVLGSESDRVVAFTQSDRTRTVGSSARILGDKSVMIRYLNPNLAATISTRGHDTLELRVLDTVTGRIVFQQTHANAASEPCHVVLFENYVVYSYYNTKVQRTEISVAALYVHSFSFEYTF